LEKYKKLKNKNAVSKLHIHPDRNPNIDIHVSSGSLGLGFPIAVGIALANKKRMVFCTISDGECAEGSVWETFRIIIDENIVNVKTIVNANGWGAYGKIELKRLMKRIKAFGFKVIEVDGHNTEKIISALKNKAKKPVVIFAHTMSNQFPFLIDQHAHYYVMNEKDYNEALAVLA
jgi:transketolase